jgi:hypothetical protein
MDRFESGEIAEALTLLKEFITDDEFGRKPTALKRAITLVSKSDDADTKWWKAWVRETALQESVPLHLSREQLTSFVRLYDDPSAAMQQLSPLFLNQPFSQPKAIFLRAVESLDWQRSDILRQAREDVHRRIRALNESENHRLKAVALVTGCKPCSGRRPAGWFPHQAGFKK